MRPEALFLLKALLSVVHWPFLFLILRKLYNAESYISMFTYTKYTTCPFSRIYKGSIFHFFFFFFLFFGLKKLFNYLPIFHFKYVSTMSRPESSLTTAMVAGTSNWNDESASSVFLHERSCFLASLIAALVAQWTEAAKSRGGSPEAAQKNSKVYYSYKIVTIQCVKFSYLLFNQQPE